MHKNNAELFGINKIHRMNSRAEYVSHFYEMVKCTNDLSNKVYLPISDKLIQKARDGYSGKLHDALHFDRDVESISCKLEFKSSMTQYFGFSKLRGYELAYSKLEVDRIDLCHINNTKAFEKTLEIVNSFNSKLVIFKPID